MTTLTLGQAARMTGLGKTTLARAIRAGRLSATRDETGRYSIDGAELARVYPFPAPTKGQDATDDVTGDPVHQATINAQRAALAGEVAALREMLAMMREQLDDVRDDRNRWRDQAERCAALPAPTSPKPVEQPMSLWRWLRTTGCLAGAGILLALATGAAAAQQQQRECFAVALNPQTSLGSVLIDKCSGKTWLLGRSGSRFSNAIRWFPITTDTNEPAGTYGEAGAPGTRRDL